MDHTPTEVRVPVDTFQVALRDQVLCARLHGSFVLCISDEVQDTGALVHVQAGRPGFSGNPDLTDNTLSTDLLLLDRCLAELRIAEPRARNWQARFIAHADPASGGFERLSALQAFVEVYLEDTGVRLVAATTHDGPVRRLAFRPAVRSISCEDALDESTQRMHI